MSVTTSGIFRVLDNSRAADELLLLDVASADPTYVPRDGEYKGALTDRVAALDPGNRIEATIEWVDGTPRFGAIEVLTETRLTFIDGATGLFEAARETAQEAVVQGEAMNSRVTKDTDGVENGVVYTFAKQAGRRDLYDEFREGITPLEPLFERAIDGGAAPPYDAFVIRPADESFLVVCIALERDGLLARTIRDTYA
jgi:hypothetical protein